MNDENPTTPTGGPLSIREPPKVLVPVEVLEGRTVPESLVRFLAPSEVVVLGYHVVPEQTPAGQARLQAAVTSSRVISAGVSQPRLAESPCNQRQLS